MGKAERLRKAQGLGEQRQAREFMAKKDPITQAREEAKKLCQEKYDCLSILEFMARGTADLIRNPIKSRDAVLAGFEEIDWQIKQARVLTKEIFPLTSSDHRYFDKTSKRSSDQVARVKRDLEILSTQGVRLPDQVLNFYNTVSKKLSELAVGSISGPLVPIVSAFDRLAEDRELQEALRLFDQALNLPYEKALDRISDVERRFIVREGLLDLAIELDKIAHPEVPNIFRQEHNGISLASLIKPSDKSFPRMVLEYMTSLPPGDALWPHLVREIFLTCSNPPTDSKGEVLLASNFLKYPDFDLSILIFQMALCGAIWSPGKDHYIQSFFDDENEFYARLKRVSSLLTTDLRNVTFFTSLLAPTRLLMHQDSLEQVEIFGTSRILSCTPVVAEASAVLGDEAQLEDTGLILALTKFELADRYKEVIAILEAHGVENLLPTFRDFEMDEYFPKNRVRTIKAFLEELKQRNPQFLMQFRGEDPRLYRIEQHLMSAINNSTNSESDKGGIISKAKDNNLLARLGMSEQVTYLLKDSGRYKSTVRSDRHEDSVVFDVTFDRQTGLTEGALEEGLRGYSKLQSLLKILFLNSIKSINEVRADGEQSAQTFELWKVLNFSEFSSLEEFIKVIEGVIGISESESPKQIKVGGVNKAVQHSSKETSSSTKAANRAMAELLEMIRRGI